MYKQRWIVYCQKIILLDYACKVYFVGFIWASQLPLVEFLLLCLLRQLSRNTKCCQYIYIHIHIELYILNYMYTHTANLCPLIRVPAACRHLGNCPHSQHIHLLVIFVFLLKCLWLLELDE